MACIEYLTECLTFFRTEFLRVYPYLESQTTVNHESFYFQKYFKHLFLVFKSSHSGLMSVSSSKAHQRPAIIAAIWCNYTIHFTTTLHYTSSSWGRAAGSFSAHGWKLTRTKIAFSTELNRIDISQVVAGASSHYNTLRLRVYTQYSKKQVSG